MIGFKASGIVVSFALGAALAAAYLGALEWNIQLYFYSNPKSGRMLHVVRLFLVASVLALVVHRADDAALIAAAAGFEAVRVMLVGREWLRAGDLR
jgi:F1F0 ATPase subunit 2